MKQRLYAPGPVEVPPEVLAALARPVLHHRTPQFRAVQERVRQRLAQVFMTEGDDVITLSGSGTAAMEAALLSTVRPGAKVVAINGGKFGERWLKLADSHGYFVVELTVDWGRAASPEQLGRLLEQHPDVSAVLATHSETSTGVLHDVEALSRLSRELVPGALFIVDAVTSLASAELRPRDWQLDAVVAGSQKGLLTPPGLGFAWLSERAWDRGRELTPGFSLNLRNYRGLKQPTTPATSLIVALDVALGLLLDEGLPAVWARRARLTELLISGARSLGFEPFPERVTPAVAALLTPDGVDARELVRALAQQGVTIAGGQDRLAASVVRPSLLGHADELDVEVVLAALRRGLLSLAQD